MNCTSLLYQLLLYGAACIVLATVFSSCRKESQYVPIRTDGFYINMDVNESLLSKSRVQRLNAALMIQRRPVSWAMKLNKSYDTALFLSANDGVHDEIECESQSNGTWHCRTIRGDARMRFPTSNELLLATEGDTMRMVFVKTDDPMTYLAGRILEGLWVSKSTAQSIKIVTNENSCAGDSSCATIEIAGPAVGFQSFDFFVRLAFPTQRTSKLFGLSKMGDKIMLSHVTQPERETIGESYVLRGD